MPGIPYRGTKIVAKSRNGVRRKQLGILFRGTKIEANSWNFVPKHLSKKICSQFCLLEQEAFVSKHFLNAQQSKISIVPEKITFEVCTNNFVRLFWLIFFAFCSLLSFEIDSSVEMPQNEHYLPRNNGTG
jgi:hypothetical protein